MPDEKSIGSVVMHYDYSADVIVAVGSGVINDIGKMLSKTTGKPNIIVATAPSMDGYLSNSSCMDRDGLKTTIYTKCPDAIIGDTEIMKNAPMEMLAAGLGDVIAKYTSILEWRISNLVNGEYYCETIADMMRGAVKVCVSNADALMARDGRAVEEVFYSLLIAGVAMAYATVTRPASGMEHYVSHALDMRHLEFGTPIRLHGLQCGVGTLELIKLYGKLKEISPSKEKALAFASAYDYEKWKATMHEFYGKAAETMIANEKVEQKYSVARHAERIDRIIDNFDEIIAMIPEELPDASDIEKMLKKMGAPTTLADLGLDEKWHKTIFKATKDIRCKYVLSHLAWDLGIEDELFG
jgi:glycerol-1-phosphate dehydrogenase [NAD(P)+]